MGRYDREAKTDEETRREYGEMVQGDNAEFIIQYVERLRHLSTDEIGRVLFLERGINPANIDAQILEAYLNGHPDLPDDVVAYITEAIMHKRSVARLERVVGQISRDPDLRAVSSETRLELAVAMCDPADLAVLGIDGEALVVAPEDEFLSNIEKSGGPKSKKLTVPSPSACEEVESN